MWSQCAIAVVVVLLLLWLMREQEHEHFDVNYNHERQLLEDAPQLIPRELRQLGKRLREVGRDISYSRGTVDPYGNDIYDLIYEHNLWNNTYRTPNEEYQPFMMWAPQPSTTVNGDLIVLAQKNY